MHAAATIDATARSATTRVPLVTGRTVPNTPGERQRSLGDRSAYGAASQFHVWLPPFVHWFVSHTSPCAAPRDAAGSDVAPA